MSKLVKSSQIIIDKKKYVLKNALFVPEKQPEKEEEVFDEEALAPEDAKASLHDELRLMKEEMLEAVKMQTDEMLEIANQEKESVIQQAYDQSSQIKESARQEGYNEGFQQGVQQGYDELASAIDEVLQEKQKYYDKYSQIKDESSKAITHIILNTVETILNKHVKEDLELIEGLVEKALEKCAFTYNLTLRVAPEDYENAISIRNYILSLTENVEHIEIKQDNALKPGSCIFDTDAGSVDSSVHTQFETVRAKFLELLQSE